MDITQYLTQYRYDLCLAPGLAKTSYNLEVIGGLGLA